MQITTISDTHGKHNQLHLTSGDILLHAGDISSRGNPVEVEKFLNWFKVQDYKYKIFIAGNHDFFFERNSPTEIASLIPDNVIYLNDSGVEIEGLKIWGSPVSPWFYDWAFNRQRGEEIKKHWDLIPDDTDILITHGPAYEVLDLTTGMVRAGCEDLLNRIKEIQPKIHLSGHIHEGYGQVKKFGTHFINASVLNERYEMVNTPIIVDL